MTNTNLSCLILAAGRGTRMKSALPKPMHKVANLPMVVHSVRAAEALSPARITVIIGPGMDAMADVVKPHPTALQAEAKGTGHAVQAGLGSDKPVGDVLVLYGDTPLVTSATLSKLIERRQAKDNPAVVVSGMYPASNFGYGRLIVDGEKLLGIVEERDADEEEKTIRLCNGGILLFDGALLPQLLGSLSNQNAKGEYYLTDTVSLARKAGRNCAFVEIDHEDVQGVNSRAELAVVESIMQKRLRLKAMESGVTMTDPDTVYLSADTSFGMDVTIGPNVYFGPRVTVADNVEIRSFCHIEETKVAANCIIGPFARFRAGNVLGQGVHIGSYVELKNTQMGAGAKANHLAYLGDAKVGSHANIGAGSITANYDGFGKYATEIGAGAFIGSNTVMVAPLKIGADALVGAGSVITADVPADAIALERSPQKMAPNRGMATRRRERQ